MDTSSNYVWHSPSSAKKAKQVQQYHRLPKMINTAFQLTILSELSTEMNNPLHIASVVKASVIHNSSLEQRGVVRTVLGWVESAYLASKWVRHILHRIFVKICYFKETEIQAKERKQDIAYHVLFMVCQWESSDVSLVTEMYDAISLGITLAFYTSYQ